MHRADGRGVLANGIAQPQIVQHRQGTGRQGRAAGIKAGGQRRRLRQRQRMAFHQHHRARAVPAQQQRQHGPRHPATHNHQRLLRHFNVHSCCRSATRGANPKGELKVQSLKLKRELDQRVLSKLCPRLPVRARALRLATGKPRARLFNFKLLTFNCFCFTPQRHVGDRHSPITDLRGFVAGYVFKGLAVNYSLLTVNY